MDPLPVLALFLARTAGGYALCLGLVGPRVTQGSWPRVSFFVLAGLAALAIPCGAPPAACGACAGSALLLERARTFGVPGLRSPIWILPFGLWLLAAPEWPTPGADALAGGLASGGTVATMLLGHSYLTARGLSFAPFQTMAWVLLAVLGARAALFVPLLWTGGLQLMDWVFLSMRGALGIVLPLAGAWMVVQCVKIRSNQSATGILYAMTVLVGVFGELIAAYLKVARGIAA
ncbi:MAG: hypothetical protein ACREID_09290 [Planctomycetota bacterium]